ncbi:MAG: hypothetical protein HS115_18365 [Spirochaetales bacterium]|nr:hypothetical protein [Spirochaetales bacterium]
MNLEQAVYLIAFVVLAVYVRTLSGRITLLQEQIELMKKQVPKPSLPPQNRTPGSEAGKIAASVAAQSPSMPLTPAAVPDPVGEETRVEPRLNLSEPRAWSSPAIRSAPEWQINLQRVILANWTGILGGVILTMGMGFLAVYTALALAPVFRFLMIVTVAALVAAVGRRTEGKENWARFSSILYAVSGATVLVACFAAVAIPGIRWIESEMSGLGLVALAVAINLVFTYRASEQSFASLHLVLSLIVLAILPARLPVLLLAALTSSAGVLMAARSRWEHQSLLCTSSYLIYNIIFLTSLGGTAGLPVTDQTNS